MTARLPGPPRRHIRFLRDDFSSARGGRSQFLDLACDRCSAFVALYQKDGPGPLKRIYVDRIAAPESLAGLKGKGLKALPKELTCPGCGELLGMPMVYAKEGRPAFRLFESVIRKTKNAFIRQSLAPKHR